MNKLFMISIALIFSTLISFGQEIPYSTGQWNPEGLGNHRAVIYVEGPSDAVKLKIPKGRNSKNYWT